MKYIIADITLKVSALEIKPINEKMRVKNHVHLIPNQSPYAKIKFIAPKIMKKTAIYIMGKCTKAGLIAYGGIVTKATERANENPRSRMPDIAIKMDNNVTPNGLTCHHACSNKLLSSGCLLR